MEWLAHWSDNGVSESDTHQEGFGPQICECSRSAAALGKIHWYSVNLSNNKRPYAYGLQANEMSNGRLRVFIVETKWPKLNEYTAHLK